MVTLKNIIDNGHKALIFSQYVSFLQLFVSILRRNRLVINIWMVQLLQQHVRNQWSFSERRRGCIFVELKSRGSGLNLTAADYVIHLDPWWNPAVEDQASDRAHRIGQERPVTVYRFVMQNTIEEKIIALHEQKRNLLMIF